MKFELNRAGVAQLLKGAEMQGILGEYASEVQSRCTAGNVGPEEYEAAVSVRGTRAVGTVRTDSPHAYYSNLKHNTLLKALGGGGS